MKRVFLAISFKDNEFISQYINTIKSNIVAENINWVDAKNMHLTLKFFGPTSDSNLKKIHNSLAEVLKDQKQLSITFNHLGVFGSKYQPRVLWMGMKQVEEIQLLEQKISNALLNIGLEADRQNFVPHLTIGRIKKLKSKKYFQSVVEKFKTFDSGEIIVDKVILYQSITHNKGAEYRILQEYKFVL